MMDKLWAPWRSKYIYSRKRKKCIFCIPKKADKKTDKLLYVVERSRHAFSMLNKYPYNNGHIMVAPYRHVKSLELLEDNELLDFIKLVNKSKALLDRLFSPEGFNIGANVGRASGAGFGGHIHMHIVPRWRGDTNFITVLNDTRIISESLDRLYEIVKKEL